jgi:elongation factor G
MAYQDPLALRNVTVLGHRATGKTTLVEAMLFAAGATNRMGTVADGSTVTDHDEDEKRRGMSITASLCHLDWRDTHINLIDCPGESSFLADSVTSIRASDCALMVVNAQAGVEVSTERLWERCEEAGLARAVVVNMLDRERASFDSTLEALREMSPGCIAVEIPMGSEGDFHGVIDLVHMTATTYVNGPKGTEGEVPAEWADAAQAAREKLIDIVAEADDELIEKYLGGEEVTQEELIAGIHKGILERRIFPVVCAAGGKDGLGADRLLDMIVDELPAPPELGAWTGIDTASGDETAIDLHEDGHAVVYCFKTVADQFSGKVNLLRVISGVLSSDSQVVDTRTGSKERVGQLMRIQGKDHEPIDQLGPGDIGAVAKLKDVTTGDVLTTGGPNVVLRPVEYPPAVMSFAVTPKTQGEEEKVGSALRRLQEEDPSLDVHRDEQTGDLIVGGLSQMHVESVLERMKRRFGVEVDLHKPHVPYRETITATAEAEGKHKKQSGGRGQYGDCWIKVEPLAAGEGFEFVDKIVGGAIPRQFIPAVEKGVHEAMQKGEIGGFPVVDVRVTLYDGKYHPVDSSEMAFKIAGSLGMKAALEKANPVLLEPIMNVEVTVPEDAVGDVMGDLNSRRGRPLGMEAKGHNQVVKAEVPMAEMLTYAPDLRAMTGGRGDYAMEFLRYEQVPTHMAQKAVEANAAA